MYAADFGPAKNRSQPAPLFFYLSVIDGKAVAAGCAASICAFGA